MNAHELLGVLSTRLVHRLSNYSAVTAGNLAIYDNPQATAEQRASALAALRETSSRTGALLDRFSELSRTLRLEAAPCPVPILITNLHGWIAGKPGWIIEADPRFSAQPNLALGGPWDWLEFSLNAIVTAHAPKTGQLRIDATRPLTALPPVHFVSDGFLTMTLSCDDASPIEWHDHREHLKDWNLTAAFELLQTLGSRPDSRALPGNVQQTRISFPLLAI